MKKLNHHHILSTDNIPLNDVRTVQCIRRAQAELVLLILLFAGRIFELIRTAYKEGKKIIVPIPPVEQNKPVRIRTSSDKYDPYTNQSSVETNIWNIHAAELHTDCSDDEPDEFRQTGIIRNHYQGRPHTAITGYCTDMTREQEIKYFKPDFAQITATLRQWFPSLLAFFEYIRHGINIDKLRRYIGMTDRLFDSFAVTRSTLVPVDFTEPGCDVIGDMKEREPGHVEQYYLYTQLEKIRCGESDLPLDFFFAKCYPGNQQLLYAFRDGYGDIVMGAFMSYDLSDTATKSCLPVSVFTVRGTHRKYTLAVPSVKKQPIYNADLIEKAEEPPVVVICDSVEIAAINQKDAIPGVIYTAWMCEKGHLEQVDLTPLFKASKLVFLIVNHSGKRLEEQYIATSELAADLRKVKGFETETFSFYQAEYEYQPYRMPYDLDGFFASRTSALGTLIEESEFGMSEEEFYGMLVRAQESLAAPKVHFWQTTASEPQEAPAAEKVKAPQFIIHYWVQKGQLTGIYAKKNHGKSPLAYTIAITATCYRGKGSVSLFQERSIIACPDPVHGCCKVIFLDFENGQTEIGAKIKSIGSVYWPDPVKQPEEYQRSRNNLIVVNMQDGKYRDYYGKDLSAPEYQQFLLDQIEEAKDTGIKGQPVDMVIIDTYNKFVGTESIKTNTNFTKLTRTLREMNIAIVVTGQLNDADRPRGFQQKLDDEYCTLIIEREDDTHAHSIEDTPHTIFPKNYRGKLKEEQLRDLSFTYPMNGRLTMVDKSGKSSKALSDDSLKWFVIRYAEQGFDYPEIASMLGMKEKTLYDRIPKAEIKKVLGRR